MKERVNKAVVYINIFFENNISTDFYQLQFNSQRLQARIINLTELTISQCESLINSVGIIVPNQIKL